jgi:enoyl-CoA hydratase/carnithine racemase
MSEYQEIEVTVEDPVATIRLNRPDKLNALTWQTLREIRQAVNAAVEDTRVVGIVITGSGRGFCAGLDASVLAEVTRGEIELAETGGDSDELAGMFSYLMQVPKPVIAAVNGVAAGGGFVLAMMSDLRIASQDAAFTTVFLKRGLMAEHGTTWMLPRLVGVGRALDLLWTSDKIDAGRAEEIGLVEQVVEANELESAARDYLVRLAETAPPLAIAETKQLVYRHLTMDYPEALREAEVSANRFAVAADAAEGASAFLERRPPRFQRLGE